jgi:formylglycine-generating enzyme required for sulfatase activity
LVADPTIDRRVAQGMFRRNFLRGTAVTGTVLATGLGTMLLWKPDRRRRVLLPSLYGQRDLKWTLIEPDALAAATPISIRGAKPIEGRTDAEMLLDPGLYRIDFQDGKYIRSIFRQVPTPEELPILSAMGIAQNHASWEVLPDGRIKLPPITTPMSLVDVPMIEHPGGSWNPKMLPGEVWGTQERVTAPFLIDAKEVTYRQFQQVFPQWEGLAGLPEDQLDSAVVDISFNELLAFAEAVGKRPMTADQFILALQGNSVRPAPWSNQSAAAQVEAIRQAAPQESWDQTESGIQGLYGKPFEWVDERPEYSGEATTKLPGALTSSVGQMLRGAVGRSWWQPEEQAAPSDQPPIMEIVAFPTDHFEKQLGFRLTLEFAPRQ